MSYIMFTREKNKNDCTSIIGWEILIIEMHVQKIKYKIEIKHIYSIKKTIKH